MYRGLWLSNWASTESFHRTQIVLSLSCKSFISDAIVSPFVSYIVNVETGIFVR